MYDILSFSRAMKVLSRNKCVLNRMCIAMTLFLCLNVNIAKAQIVEVGIKGGPQLTWVRHDNLQFRKEYSVSPRIGYQAGAVLSFKVKDRYFLHTEYLYSVKGKVTSSKSDPDFKDKVTYSYIEVPILYNIFFKGHLGKSKQFKYYAGAGPILSYWLGGKGTIYSTEFAENSAPPLDYKIKFGVRSEDFNDPGEVYVNRPRRFQLGFNIGGGIMTEPDAKRRIMLDLRFELGHSWFSKSQTADYVIPVVYEDNMQSRNMGFRLSAIYMFEINTNKKARNKGKTNRNSPKKNAPIKKKRRK